MVDDITDEIESERQIGIEEDIPTGATAAVLSSMQKKTPDSDMTTEQKQRSYVDTSWRLQVRLSFPCNCITLL